MIRHPHGDDGFTLLEMMVALTVSAILMALGTGAFVAIFRSTQRVDATSAVSTQVNIAFERLDKQIRYAYGISDPGPVGADPYVEFVGPNVSAVSPTPAPGALSCFELRVDNGILQQRSWPVTSMTDTSSSVPTTWTTLATGLTTTAASSPFTKAVSTSGFQQLTIAFTTGSGTNSSAASKQSNLTFSALNTSPATSSGTVCSNGRSA